LLLLCAAWVRGQDAEPDVRIAGPISTKPLLTALVRAMKEEKGLTIAIDTGLTSADAVDALAQEKAGIALMTRPLTGEERAQYPQFDLFTTPIGMEVVALGISNDLWEAGLHSVTKDAMRSIYEQKVTNWKEVGGPDEKITFLNPEQGLGIWEIFAEWLYGDNRKAPLPKVEKVNTGEDARDDLEFIPGAIAPIAAPLADGTRCHALGIDPPGKVARPTPEDVAKGAYSIARPILAVTVGQPVLAIRTVTEYLTSPAGQALLRKYGALGADAVPKPSPNPYF
jgi:phosphate transport system substrate-binding protein